MSVNLEDISIHAWIRKHGLKTEDGKPIEFKQGRYMFDIVSDLSPNLCCPKAAQIRFSVLSNLKMFWVADKIKMNIIYTLPTAAAVNSFVSSKTNRLIAQNPVLQRLVKDKDTIQQKRVGDSVIFFDGTMTERGSALMVSSDLNIHDEIDRSDLDNIAQYSTRQQHSPYKWQWVFSNPSHPGHGVDAYWQKSDKKHWFVKCGRCNEKQFLSWPESVDIEAKTFNCKHCRKILTDEERRLGEWVAEWRERKEWSGYWISLMMAPWVSAAEIVNYYLTQPPDQFWNFTVGLPYVGEGNIVLPETFLRNCVQKAMTQEEPCIGVDVGIKKHWVIGNQQGVFGHGVTENWDDIERLLNIHPRSTAVIDAGPDITKPRELREKYPGRVFLCHFARDRKTMQLIRWGKDDEYGNVNVDRNRALQFMIDEFAKGLIPLYGSAHDWQDVYEHFKNMFRVDGVDSIGSPIFEWKSNGNDHYAFAMLYWRVAMSRFGGSETTVLGTPGLEGVKQGINISLDGTATLPNPSDLFDFSYGQVKDDWRE